MLNREQKEKKDLINAIKVLDVELNKKIERKEELLRSEKITPVIARKIEEINFAINKKNKQLKNAKQKLESFARV
ncbi:MAG: hypothetical protein HXK70_01675 [Clostridiales bacterium]|jgi:hypothetical protein|nr:hypothetical protein [Clostridiales bacterium]